MAKPKNPSEVLEAFRAAFKSSGITGQALRDELVKLLPAGKSISLPAVYNYTKEDGVQNPHQISWDNIQALEQWTQQRPSKK